RLGYKLRPEEAKTIQFGIARAAEIHFAAGATEVYPNVGPVSVIPRGRLEEFEALDLRPGDLRLEGFHPMSSARIGSGPQPARGPEGVYVTDAGLLPTSVGVNPMMTIIACSIRVAKGLAARLS